MTVARPSFDDGEAHTGFVADTLQCALRTRDGVCLPATWYLPARPRAALVVHGGAGLDRRLYAQLAHYLARHDVATLTYDYRSLEHAAPNDAAADEGHFTRWAEADLEAATCALRERTGELPHYALAHGMGAQLLALAPSSQRLHGVISYGAGPHHWRALDRRWRWLSAALARGSQHVTDTTHHLAKLRTARSGSEIPQAMAEEWARWTREHDYFQGQLSGAQLLRYANFRAPWLALHASDDPIGHLSGAKELLRLYTSLTPQCQLLRAADYGMSLGHLGFFTRARPELWRIVLAFLRPRAQRARPHAA